MKIGSAVPPGRVLEKMWIGRQSKMSPSGSIFTYLGRSPHCTN